MYVYLFNIVKNVEHLLKLSDEYQVNLIFDHCVKFLERQPIEEGNIMKILILATSYHLEKVRQSCYTMLKDKKLCSICALAEEWDLDKEDLQNIMSQRIERLEKFLEELYSLFIRAVEYGFKLCHVANMYMQWCPKHFSSGASGTDIVVRLQDCTICKDMLDNYSRLACLRYDGSLPSVIKEFSRLKKQQ